MKTLIMYDSLYGNTKRIAESIGRALSGQNKILSVKEARAEDIDGVDRLIVGSPTQGGKATAGVAEFLGRIPPGAFEDVRVAAFDTRLSTKLVGLFGYAAGKIMSDLNRKGGIGIAAPEGFAVRGKNGPLQDGELERAAEWAGSLEGPYQAAGGRP